MTLTGLFIVTLKNLRISYRGIVGMRAPVGLAGGIPGGGPGGIRKCGRPGGGPGGSRTPGGGIPGLIMFGG